AITMRELGIAQPMLIGREDVLHRLSAEMDLQLEGIEIMDPTRIDARMDSLTDAYYFDRKRHGVLREDAANTLRHDINVLGAMLVRQGFADGMLSGRTAHYPNVLRPVLKVLGHDQQGQHYHVYGLYIMIMEHGAYLLADCTVNVDMSAEELARLAVLAHETALSLGIEPRIGMLSFSNFGSAEHAETRKVAEAVRLLHERHADIVVDGEMQADTAVNADILRQYPFSHLKEPANVLIFPTMQAGNIAYKLLKELGGGQAIGPILLGLPQQVHVLQTGASVDDIVNMAAIASARAQ
ncbi:MAG: NADP-dependent malic enzyme, partial [Zetaproteobacteria bacterium]